MMIAEPLILTCGFSPGDVLCMTAAIYSLHVTHPGRYTTAVKTTTNEIFEHNPDIVPVMDSLAEKTRIIEMHYPLINQSGQRAVHVMQGFCDFLADTLKVSVPLMTNRPLVYLSNREKLWTNQVAESGINQPFWLINAGYKTDFTNKFWGHENFQEVVNQLRGKVLFVQVGAREHTHRKLDNVIDFTGKTDHRQLIRLAYHAQGGIGGVTYLQHLMAAHQKPYVCIMGGREPVQWNAYPRQQTLHTIGALPCCKESGCWKSRVIALKDGANEDKSLCELPLPGPLPTCMAMIKPDEVVKKVLLYT